MDYSGETTECIVDVPAHLLPIITELKASDDVQEDVLIAAEEAVAELAIEQCKPASHDDVAAALPKVRTRGTIWQRAQRLVRRTPLPLVDVSLGEQLEAGWARRGQGSSFRRNVEVWRFGLRCALQVLKASKMDDGLAQKAAATEAATFIRDGLVKLGPTFVKVRGCRVEDH